jgi:hypothetical protein
MTMLIRRPTQQTPAGGRESHAASRLRALAIAALVTGLLAGGWSPVFGVFFPTWDPDPIFEDDFELANNLDPPDPTLYTVFQDPLAGWTPKWRHQDTDHIDDVENGMWGDLYMRSEDIDEGERTVLVVNKSMEGNVAYDATEWDNIRIDVDISGWEDTAAGVAFGLQDANNDGLLETGYYFYIDSFPVHEDALTGARAQWHLVRQTGGAWTELGSGPVELDPPNNNLLTTEWRDPDDPAYRLRVEFFCNNFRVQVQRQWNPAPGIEQFAGCGGSLTDDPEARWCPVVEWFESGSRLTPGMAGLYSAGTNPVGVDARSRFDNLKISTWRESCDELCTQWYGWGDTTETWWAIKDPTTVNEKIERLEFKFLYEAALHDYGGVNRDPQGRIDNAVNHTDAQRCDGWSLAVDLPEPADGPGSNLDALRSFLEPMSSAVELVNTALGGSCAGPEHLLMGDDDLCFTPDFDNDPDSAGYNPIPFVTFGSTPIEDSLDDAYAWYKEQIREPSGGEDTGGPWYDDPLRECRNWYIILITDGEESPFCSPDAYGSDCTAAEDFREVAGTGLNHEDLPPVPIYTIGFAGGFTGTGVQSTVECLSTETDGEFRVAADAEELAQVLFYVLQRLDERDRSFVPFKVSPPPSSQGGRQATKDSLALFPFFVPREGHTVWPGTMYAFRLNKDNPKIPVKSGACEIDFDQMLWDASGSLTSQIMAATPVRNVFFSTQVGGVWTRYDLDDIENGGSTTVRNAFRTLLNWPVAATDLQVQEVVNFLRYEWKDNDGDGSNTNPQHPPKSGVSPGGRPIFDRDLSTEEAASALGDVYHSQPVLVNPPNTSMYFYDYGFVAQNERGAHNYIDFMEKHALRRRVALAGSNDGMLHAHDAGFWDREEQGTDYDGIHDLGTGDELFAFVPNAVFPRLHNLTYGEDQQYMVDGPTSVGDVFIRPSAGADPEWRTVAISTMRRGGRGMVALDITQPDPLNADDEPTASALPGCTSNVSGCDGQYPNVLWEFRDNADADANGYADLGWTWSKPAIARLGIYNAGDTTAPTDMFVAFFGGGWDRPTITAGGGITYNDRRGTYVYGVNIETGAIVLKYNIGTNLPGGFTALDSNLDGFHDRIYFGDTNGGIWRIKYPAPDNSGATGPDIEANGGGAKVRRIWNLTGTSDIRQQFFARPVTVPTLFGGGSYTWGLAIGSGDRANLQRKDRVVDGTDNEINNFFFLLDTGEDGVTRDHTNLSAVNYDQLTGDYTCPDNTRIDPDANRYGWRLKLRANEKVNFEATVLNGHVLFPTFEATDTPLGSGDVVDMCGGGGPTPTPTTVGDTGGDVFCSGAGIGREYDLWFECGYGEEKAVNDIITGLEDYTIDGITYVTFTVSEVQPGITEEFVTSTGYATSNWRQD